MRYDPKGAEAVISWEHSQVHGEKMFTFSDEATGVNIATPKRYHFKVPDLAFEPHFAVAVAATNASKVELFEAPTTSADGTLLTAQSRNRRNPKAARLLCYKDPTVSGDGTVIGTARGGANVPIIPGSMPRGVSEFVLKRNTAYHLKITVTVDSTTVTVGADFYEVD